ncbi:hypothetical protein, partial [Klebsiella michiganensis]|uniref:hypothetical protein n=1 Tax=Klebsiella michiganensis TaxID=1134687 RepID=UPI0031E2BA0D
TDDLFVGKTLLHRDALTLLMKTLLTSRCINQRGAGQFAHELLAIEYAGWISSRLSTSISMLKRRWY